MTTNPDWHGTSAGLPPAGPARTPDSRQLPLTMSHADMDTAFENGTALPLTEAIGWVMRYRSAWWVIYEDGWLHVPEGHIADSLDQLHPRLIEAEAQAAAEARRERNRKGGR